MKYLFISVFIHVFLLICLTILNVKSDFILSQEDENFMTIDVVTSTYKKPIPIVPVNNTSKLNIVSRKLIKNTPKNKNSITQDNTEQKKVIEVSEQLQTQLDEVQVKQVQLSYVQKLKLYIEKNKHYPRQAVRLRQSGTVRLRLKISKEGVFSSIEVFGSSDFPILDKAALRLIKKIGKFSPLPSIIKPGSYFTVPIAYNLRE